MKILSKAKNYASTSVTGVGYSEPIGLDVDVSEVIVELRFDTASTASVQSSMDAFTAIEAGSASWIAWDAGNVTSATIKVAKAPQALRVYNQGAGTVTMVARSNT